jgi:hypothetical protein
MHLMFDFLTDINKNYEHFSLSIVMSTLRINLASAIHTAGIIPYPANVDKMMAPASASKWRMGFNPYPANVDKMVGYCQC